MSTTQLHANLIQSLQAVLLQQQFCLQGAKMMDAAGLQVVSHAFRFTAAQEREHAAILAGLLHASPDGDALPPPPAVRDVQALLESAAAREEDSLSLLHLSAAEAQSAGLPRAAHALECLAGNEARHAGRFRRYLSALADGTLLHSDAPTCWVCLRCGCLHRNCSAPEECEGCSARRGSFIRSDFHPFSP